MKITVSKFSSPVGPLTIAAAGDTLYALEFGSRIGELKKSLQRRFPDAELVRDDGASPLSWKLAKYFEGDAHAIDDMKAEPGGTEFQAKVWKALRRIPAGRTWTYAQMAKAVGRPKAARAVGAAVGANPIAVVIPCHRVIGTDGTLTGFGGGLPAKEWLLKNEGALLL